MARGAKRLSALDVKAKSEPGRYADGDGLYLRVWPNGSKSWVFLWMRDGRRREKGLGAYPLVSLAGAREKTEAARRAVSDGRDPIDEALPVKAEAPKSFADAVDAFLASQSSGWKNAKHRAQWEMTLGDTYCASLRKSAVGDIGTPEVLAVLSPVWKKKPETASRLRGRIERVLDFAQVQGWRSGENPARWRGHLKIALPSRQKLTRGHHAAMPYTEVPAFVQRMRALPGLSARGLELLILTAARSGEVMNAAWGEFDLAKALWTVPAERMKAGRIHRVPLTPAAVAVLQRMEPGQPTDLIMPGERKRRPMSNMAFAMLMRRMKVGHFTPHGFRSAFRDWAGDETEFPRELAEAALAHTVGDQTERAYCRSDALERRRQLMDAWAAFCGGAGKNDDPAETSSGS